MKGWIANTHHGWFDFFAQKQYWPEVNFWTPSDYDAFRGEPGSPFFFRLLAPRNKIGGFGYVQRHARLPEWLAWECFGEGNGAPSLPVMSERLAAIRAKSDIKGGAEFKQIGCIILAEAVPRSANYPLRGVSPTTPTRSCCGGTTSTCSWGDGPARMTVW